MALEKQIYTDDNTGVSATYWIICDLYGDWKEKTMFIKLCGYISAQARAEGRKEVLERSYTLSGDMFDIYFSPTTLNPEGVNVVSQGYLYVKGHAPDFIDAVDV
jgi:hypothetical protein